MASATLSVGSDECPICTNPLKTPRVLDCQHVYCLNCLETLESNNTIKCPQCHTITDIPVGLSVRHLPKRGTLGQLAARRQLQLLKKVEIKHGITSVKIDEEEQVIYIGTRDTNEPIQIYSLLGKQLGHLAAGVGTHPTVAVDTKRELILSAFGLPIVSFDKEGTRRGSFECQEFQCLQDIVYQPHDDRYVVGDVMAQRLYYFDPDTEKVVHTVQAEEARIAQDGGRNFYLAASKTMTNTALVTLDMEKGLVKLYDGDGTVIRSYGGAGGGYGQFDRPQGICVDPQSRVVVSDLNNQRLVLVSPDVVGPREWQVLGGTERLELGHPRTLDVTEEGLAAVAFFTDAQKGPFYLAILSGLN